MVVTISRSTITAAVFAILVLLMPSPALAEPYIGLYVGGAFTQSSQVDIGAGASFTLHDIHFDTSVLVGAKAGYFFDRPVLGGHLGVELDVYHFRPDIDTQFGSATVGGVPVLVRFTGSDLEITGITANALYRFPVLKDPEFPNGRLHPYAGIGLGGFIATLSSRSNILDQPTDLEDTDARFGVQAVAGAKFFVTKNIAVFGEYKYLHIFDFDFTPTGSGTIGGAPAVAFRKVKFDLDTHLLQAGIAFHW